MDVGRLLLLLAKGGGLAARALLGTRTGLEDRKCPLPRPVEELALLEGDVGIARIVVFFAKHS